MRRLRRSLLRALPPVLPVPDRPLLRRHPSTGRTDIMNHTDSVDGGELRVGDRITVLPGKARSGHTYRPLTCPVAIEVIHLRRDHDGSLDVEGVLLTSRGAWRA